MSSSNKKNYFNSPNSRGRSPYSKETYASKYKSNYATPNTIKKD